jgi:mannose-6-phosphate isomerase-like protein (cupin superfamily)
MKNEINIRFAFNSGEYQMHNHPNSDEFFLIINNSITVKFESDDIELKEMDILTITKSTNHKLISENRSGIVFFESTSCESILK